MTHLPYVKWMNSVRFETSEIEKWAMPFSYIEHIYFANSHVIPLPRLYMYIYKPSERALSVFKDASRRRAALETD